MDPTANEDVSAFSGLGSAAAAARRIQEFTTRPASLLSSSPAVKFFPFAQRTLHRTTASSSICESIRQKLPFGMAAQCDCALSRTPAQSEAT
jgi:hypothetical protein